MNIATLLEMAADAMGDRVAVGGTEAALTYSQLLDRARRLARLLHTEGAERTGLVDLNSDVVPVLLYGSALAGVPFAPMNYRLADDRLCSLCDRISPALVIAGVEARARIADVAELTLLDPAALSAELLGVEPADATEPDSEAVAIWLFTSGTTGEPKAALLRHRHLVSYVLSSVEFMGADEDQATLVSVPPYHIAGMATILSNTFAGRRLVYLPQFDPQSWVVTAAAERITHAMVVPTMLGRILDVVEATKPDLGALRHLSYGGGRMPAATVERAIDLLGDVGLVNAYGLTETSSTIAILRPEDHRDAHGSADPIVRARLGSVGRPLPSVEIEIRGPDGTVLGPGEHGEIYARGEQIAGEYDGRSVLTADGWFPTNDGGHLDAAGFLFVEGRLDDVIVRGGENMSPGEIEDALLAHPAVADVAVTGIPDDEWGEAVGAAVVLYAGEAPSVDDLRAWVRERLRSSRVPSVIKIVPELPYNYTGKLLRRVVKAQLSASEPVS